jgi:TPR repeat protein
LATLAVCQAARAVDPDILISIQERQAEVTPLCASLVRLEMALDVYANYQRALCLLYGVQVSQQTDAAIDMLRRLANQGLLESQMALADTLQQGDTAQQKEAQQWYAQASNAGDVRATMRLTRLTQRLKAGAESSSPTATDSLSDTIPDGGKAPWQQPGYHCHIYGLGKKVCHGGMD